MGCPHLKYLGGTYGCYKCDLCGKTWDWKDPHVEEVCSKGSEYTRCEIWKKYSW